MNVKTPCNDARFLVDHESPGSRVLDSVPREGEAKTEDYRSSYHLLSCSEGSGKKKPSQKPICRDFLTDQGYTRRGQCTYQHSHCDRLWLGVFGVECALDIFENPYGVPDPRSPKTPRQQKKFQKTRKSRLSPKVNARSPKVNARSPKVNVKYF